ncbi:MAG TPA: chromosome segregation protein SMC [Candidatus Egerieimonas intestinavium]|uniref:Chromosome segregation protein SMC n=1 Tax=Candidatus Egerieimonas intestinavium TaxID=2840777 RepID=A0A9D1EM72_9FIRM|nr:chromosome segregation protein SMC [Candidatus Egerieimonas intestinavium]
MSFFQAIDDKFFNPFCCRNREIYFECISQLIERSKEIPILYEGDARNTLILYLQNCQYSIETENIGEEIGSGRTPQENASVILRYFRACGWITPQEIGRSGDNIASVSAYCRKLIDAIHKIFDGDANGAITNHIFSMYEILQSSFGKDSARAVRPYLNILVPLVENECDLKNELLVLKDSIREIMRAVIQMGDANSFGQFLMKDELLNQFFNDYFFIKKSGLIPSYIAGIDRMLRKLRRSELYERMVAEYQKMENVGEALAREKIDRQFGELDSFVNLEYQQEIDYIDRKINTYYNLYSTRMMMVLSDNTNLEHELNRLLLFLKDLDGEEREQALLRLAEAHRLMSVGYIGRKSIERRRKVNPHRKNVGLLAEELPREEKQRLTDQLLTEMPDRYSLDQAEKYFNRILADRREITVGEYAVKTRADATMIAASMIYSGTAGFSYEVEIGEEMVETEAAQISKVKIKRKES